MRSKHLTERQEQCIVIAWIGAQHKWLLDHTIYIMNERRCSVHVGAMLNKQGRLPGASDLFIAYPTKTKNGLFIEMKSMIGRPTPAQLVFIDRMNRVGYYACVAKGADVAIQVIKDYLAEKL
jgi:hypothetical protein